MGDRFEALQSEREQDRSAFQKQSIELESEKQVNQRLENILERFNAKTIMKKDDKTNLKILEILKWKGPFFPGGLGQSAQAVDHGRQQAPDQLSPRGGGSL